EPETPQPALRSFALIMARCESAATLLGWRKQITPEQKRRLDAAIYRLQEASAQVAVRASVHNVPPKRFERGAPPLKPRPVVSHQGQPAYRPVNGSPASGVDRGSARRWTGLVGIGRAAGRPRPSTCRA